MGQRDLHLTDELVIPEQRLEFRFSRASGAGGQNVNKINSRVELWTSIDALVELPVEVRDRLQRLGGKRVTHDGWLRITSQKFRDQLRNIEDCCEKLEQLIHKALVPPESRVATRVPGRIVRQRLNDKRHRAKLKQARTQGSAPD